MAEPARILLDIVERRRRRWAEDSGPAAAADDPARGEAFLAALRSSGDRAVVAEVKMGSPRLGSLAGRLDPERQARLYREHGAAALSVVVEPDFFYGSYELLRRCCEASGLPALAKDFVVDERQLAAARAAGAGAVLLIAALYSRDELRRWAGAARSLGLVPLVETHDAEDVTKLDGASWELVGVNNRDLRTFEVDLSHGMKLAPTLPRGALRIAESGIASSADVERLAAAGFDAFLVGEALLTAPDPAVLLEEMVRPVTR